MIDGPSLPDFCAEMHRLAGLIEARAEFLPTCGGPDRGGFRISLSDGAAYVLSYSEKGMTDVLVESADAEAVMEQVFVQVTRRIATEDWSRSRTPITPEEMAALGTLSVGEMRRRAEALQSNEAVIQFRLMDRLNPEWGRRQLDRNAEREQQIQHFFDKDRP